MRSGKIPQDSAVSTLLEYMIISGILMILMVITLLTLSSTVIEQPVNQLSDYAFIDIGNGVSTRIVDLYVVAPSKGDVTTKFDIPDDIAGREYFVQVSTENGDQRIVVFRGQIAREVSLAGIGSTHRGSVSGSTTGHGLNIIRYSSEGFP